MFHGKCQGYMMQMVATSRVPLDNDGEDLGHDIELDTEDRDEEHEVDEADCFNLDDIDY